MDSSNFHDVMALAGDREDWQRKVKMFLAEGNVPDPYYGGADGFTHVYDLVNDAADAWTDQWRDHR